jgi:hypothetical protein
MEFLRPYCTTEAATRQAHFFISASNPRDTPRAIIGIVEPEDPVFATETSQIQAAFFQNIPQFAPLFAKDPLNFLLPYGHSIFIIVFVK